MSQGYGKEAGPKGAGKSGGKKGWSPNGFSGQCYNCLEFGHSAKWCTKGKGSRVSWMGGPWEQEWGAGGGEETKEAPFKQLSHLRSSNPIKITARYAALRSEDEEEEEE